MIQAVTEVVFILYRTVGSPVADPRRDRPITPKLDNFTLTPALLTTITLLHHPTQLYDHLYDLLIDRAPLRPNELYSLQRLPSTANANSPGYGT
ncbi:unnamed protein product [Nezara viridula]|uniref:Uncharacterized protein n=1 Tax=Nezara viridula TaxID=85310 RepID=A0A9P0HBE8_NEZVI|nr:unnamed protein product [Nezara viridula]